MPRNTMQYVQTSKLDLNKIQRQADGSIILNAGAFKVGDYEHLGFEVPLYDVRYDDILIGRLERAEAVKVLDKFEGLPVTRNHEWIDTLNDRKEKGVGTVMVNAVLEKIEGEEIAVTRVVFTDPTTITKIETKEYQELSIGFSYLIEDVRGKVEGVDFLIKDIELNHMALVKEGRAGKPARLYNHAKHKEFNMAKVKIGEVDYDVPEEVATHIQSLSAPKGEGAGDTVASAEYARVVAENTRLTAKVDTLSQKKTEDESVTKANEIARAHSEFSVNLRKFGVEFNKAIGEYSPVDEMKDALTKAGYTVKPNADDVYVQAMFDMAQEQLTKESPVGSFTFPKTDATVVTHQSYGEIDASNKASKSFFLGKGE